MAMWVVVRFEDDQEAKDFMTHCDGQSSIIHQGKVSCAVKAPTQFCTCPKPGKEGASKGQKYGWWVHSDCGKPYAKLQNVSESILARVFIGQGKDLLEPTHQQLAERVTHAVIGGRGYDLDKEIPDV